MELSPLSPSSRKSAARFARNRVRPVPRRAIIGALLCALSGALGCRNTDDADEVRWLERQLTASAGDAAAADTPAGAGAHNPTFGCRIRVLGHTASGDADPQSARVRVVVETDGDVPFRRREHRRPDGTYSVSLELEGVRCPEPDKSALPKPLISIEAQVDDVASVLTFVLPAAAEAQLTRLTEPVRFVLDVGAHSEHADDRAPLIVLDPGHGGHDRGTHGLSGAEEAPLVLDIARRAARWLKRYSSHARVVLTRDSDVTLSLEERAALANTLGADVFVSVHLSAAEGAEERAGVATYVLDTKGDTSARKLAARENGTSPGATSPLQLLVGGLVHADLAKRSASLAEAVQFRVVRHGRKVLPKLPSRGVRHSLLYVLVGAAMPAILVESAVLTQPEEAAALSEERFRDALAEGLASGIVRYLTSR